MRACWCAAQPGRRASPAPGPPTPQGSRGCGSPSPSADIMQIHRQLPGSCEQLGRQGAPSCLPAAHGEVPGMPVTPETASVGTATSPRAGSPGTALDKMWVLLKRGDSPPAWAPSRERLRRACGWQVANRDSWGRGAGPGVWKSRSGSQDAALSYTSRGSGFLVKDKKGDKFDAPLVHLVLPSLLPVLRPGLKALLDPGRPETAGNEPGPTLPRAPGLCRQQGARPAPPRRGQSRRSWPRSLLGARRILHYIEGMAPHPVPSPPTAILPSSARTPARPRGAAPGLSAV